ncbi:MAG: hypothetical protein HY960_09870 [Ignavibacteriae bacterium]|nr:hypothetical protein [Ignavibacteriota bacterium]
MTISEEEFQYLKILNVEQLYVKFFDVDWDDVQQIPLPITSVKLDTDSILEYEIIPVVFITNRTFTHIRIGEVEVLSNRVANKIQEIASNIHSKGIKEIQIDCDWSEKSKETYFLFLKKIRTYFHTIGINTSATIRLHQVKYKEITGVPPVDRGVLMFYNMGKLEDPTTLNSILNIETAEKYVEYLGNYSLSLDIALPLFSWGVVIRKGQVVHLLNNLTMDDIQDSGRFDVISSNNVNVTQSTYHDYFYLYKNDKIRIEQVSVEQLLHSTEIFKNYFDSEKSKLIFYHLDKRIIKRYSHEDITTVCNSLY